jgi:hypothetical protein
LKLTLENIGPLDRADLELIRGLTVLYGLSETGAGKTTVAKALRLLVRLNMGVADASDVVGLVKRLLRYMDRSLAEKEGKVGRIVYDMDGAALEIRCVPARHGAMLKIGNWERYVSAGERLPAVDRPRIALVWAAHGAVRLYGVGTHEGEALSVEDLLTPSVFRGVVSGIYDDAMDLYEEVLGEVNSMLETLDYNIMYRDGVYYKHGALHVYTPDEVSSGVRRFALIYLAHTMAKKFAEYAKIEPVLFVENFEDSLDVTMMSAVIDILRTSGMISVIETHSGYPLREATIRGKTNYYVFINGKTTRDLKVDLFKREIAEWSDLNSY